jgi:hypothetical protein
VRDLVGYAAAQPWVPRARSRPGFLVAIRGLYFLRGVARAARVAASKVDCRALTTFYRAFRRLGATPNEALALRAELLRRRAGVVPKLALSSDCRIQ